MTEPFSSTIHLTKAAITAARELSAEASHQNKSLRLYIEGKGCDGFFYGVCFDETTADDLHFPQGGIDLICDKETIIYVAGATIDWVDDERGRGFLVDNPSHKKFRGKFFKRQSYETWLEKNRSRVKSSMSEQ